MSKITNDGLTRSGTGCLIAVPYGNSGRQRVKATTCSSSRNQIAVFVWLHFDCRPDTVTVQMIPTFSNIIFLKITRFFQLISA